MLPFELWTDGKSKTLAKIEIDPHPASRNADGRRLDPIDNFQRSKLLSKPPLQEDQ
jgi:hypothetical protein